jgi:hypothetical protein
VGLTRFLEPGCTIQPSSSHALTISAAKLKLVEHARKEDQEAIHLLEIMFPEEAKRVSKNTKKTA